MDINLLAPATARDALRDGDTRACVVDTDDGPRQLILVCCGGETRAFLNSCPHQGVRLDWQPGVFLDVAGLHLMCSMHGALFSLGDGRCVSGPCAGRTLVAVPLLDKDGLLGVDARAAIPTSAREFSSAGDPGSAPSPRGSA